MLIPNSRNSFHTLCLLGVVLMQAGLCEGLEPAQFVSLDDLNTAQISKQAVGPGASVSSIAYFASSDSEHGTEVWRYSGSSATLFRDARPGPESGNPSQLTTVGNNVVYVADDGVHGPELFTTANISASGLLGDVQPGSTHAAPTILGASNGWLWFTTPSTSTSLSQRPATELWVTNGTSPPVKKGFFAENSISNVTVLPTSASTTRPALFFLARPHGAPAGYLDLFWAQGSGNATGIDRLRTNNTVPLPTSPVYAVTTDFVCYHSIDNNTEPWIRNLSGGSPSVLATIMGGSSQPTHFVSNAIDTVCFAATSAAGGREVWTTHGPGTTTQLADVVPGTSSSNPTALMMSPGNPGVFFQVESGGGHRDLYFADQGANPVFKKYDSWVENTEQHTIVSPREIAYLRPEASWWQIKLADGVNDFAVNLGSLFNSVARMWNSSTTISMGSSLYVIGTTSTNGEELYRRNGSSLNPIFLATSPASDSARPRHFFPYGSSEQLFVADTSSTQGRLYRLDSGSANSVTLATPNDVFSNNASSLPEEFTEADGGLFFTAHDGQNRRLFLTTTGQAHSVSVIGNLYDPEQLVAFQDRLFLLARATAGGTGVKQLFQVEIDNGNASASLVNAGYNATALKAAAGRLFFVEQHDGTIERLNCLDSGFSVTTLKVYYKDTAGIGITQLTASSAHLYFTALQGSHPTNKRVVWATDGTGTPAEPPFLIDSPQLLGALGDACVLWNDPGNNNDYDAWVWEVDSAAPAKFYTGPIYDTPEKHRLIAKPAGIEVAGRFYFTTQSGRVMETDGIGLQVIFNNSSLKVRPESLSTLSGKLLFMATSSNYDCLLLSHTFAEGPTNIWTTSDGSLPCPMVPVGGRLYFTASHLNDNIGWTELWRTDGTNAGTELIRHDLARRELSNVAMGLYRDHLVLAEEPKYNAYGLEPAVLNHEPVIHPPPPLTGALRNQPFAFTYAQIVQGLATDEDGDTLTPLRLIKSAGTLTRNGIEVESSTDLVPGDAFVWTPPSGQSGFLYSLFLDTSDGWKQKQEPVIIEVKSPHNLWSEARFTPTELADSAISAPDADPNGNGVPNAFEFIFGRDPKAPDASPGWAPSVATPAGGGGLVMRFSFTRATVLAEGTVLVVEGSPDLTPDSWEPIATKTENTPWSSTATVTEELRPDGRTEVHVDVPLGTEPAFFRLKADL
ncbi:hypothetical protein [Prosthecobacter sp.]|uniref:hypothetical protein n=1 Tax=Prosthecobacter sp. TaxID=1965333 RepID=UPI002ABAFB70|nr:hypothetical protein [Prosthecobacter sp.]MDZ4406230.1 hypothetical protein [Prosthecobacter sp.]